MLGRPGYENVNLMIAALNALTVFSATWIYNCVSLLQCEVSTLLVDDEPNLNESKNASNLTTHESNTEKLLDFDVSKKIAIIL